MTLYPLLKHDHQFDTWNRETKAVANTQGISNVLDPKYAPTAIDTIALFKEQKIFMFAVFNKILLTDQGKKIVRAHELDSNAQVIYEELRDYSLESTRSSLDASKLLTHITSSRIDDGHWRGTTHGYLLHWQDQVRKYHTMVPKSDNFHDNQLRTMIQNAIKTQTALQVVQSQANQFKVQNGKDLSYHEYCALLESAAVAYDDTNKDKPRANRKVYSHDIQFDIDYQANPDDEPPSHGRRRRH
jgi:type II secretory pathway pseudopilin PulG